MFVRLLLLTLSVICVVLGVNYFKRTFNIGPGLPDLTDNLQRPSGSASPVVPSPALVATESAQLMAKDQLGLLLAMPLLLDESGIASNSVSLAYIREVKPSMVVLFGSEIPATAAAAVTAQLHALPDPPLVAVDHEGGTVQRLSGAGFTVLPSWQQLCSMQAVKRTELLASSAAELKRAGIQVVLGPVVDRTASGSALRSRSCSSNPEKIAQVAQELINTYKMAGITAMLKHYPGIGSSRADLHTQSAKVMITPDDTQPFEQLLTASPDLPVMISHLRIDPADPNTPCSMSYLCVGELHRVFPDSLLVSDALEMKSAGFLASSSAVVRPLPERASASLKAGVDVLLFGPSVTESDLTAVRARLERDFIKKDQLDTTAQTHSARTTKWKNAISQ